ncbi:MAG: peptidogalycan biosysnthesis protein, partial [Chromatiaceae bacterium]
ETATDEETDTLEDLGFARRLGCQFHWDNRGYRDFADFLGSFSSAKRKKVLRERRCVLRGGQIEQRTLVDEISGRVAEQLRKAWVDVDQSFAAQGEDTDERALNQGFVS